MARTNKCFELEIITPAGAITKITCDSVHLTLADGRDGHSGGEIGIRCGHAPAVFLLDKGETNAFLNGEKILSCRTGPGFATTDGDLLSVMISEIEQQ